MTVRIKVIPRSPRTEIVGELADGTLKVRIASAPERGRANDELIGLLAAKYGVDREAVKIVSGHSAGLMLLLSLGLTRTFSASLSSLSWPRRCKPVWIVPLKLMLTQHAK